jgi:hypothetical protein
MTLAPLVSPDIRGVEGQPGDVSGECAAPGCHSPAQQRHHIWPRSFLRGQPYEWINVKGITLQNSCGLCVACHSAVTGEVGGHRAHIRYDQDRGLFEWWAKGSVTYEGEEERWFFVGHLKRKGLIDGQPEAKRIRTAEGLCPECGRPLKSHAPKDPLPKRKATTYTMLVPDDEEVGTDVMDDWVDQFAAMLGFDEAGTRLRRYHVIALVMAWAAINQERFLADLEEAEFFSRRA